MEIKSGKKTSEFWLSAILGMIGPVVTVLVGSQIITAEEGEQLSVNAETIAQSVAVVISNITSALAVLGYGKNRTNLKVEALDYSSHDMDSLSESVTALEDAVKAIATDKSDSKNPIQINANSDTSPDPGGVPPNSQI